MLFVAFAESLSSSDLEYVQNRYIQRHKEEGNKEIVWERERNEKSDI